MSTAAATHGITTADGRALSPAQWGLLSFLVSEVALFGTLIVTYIFYLGRDVMGGPTPAWCAALTWRSSARPSTMSMTTTPPLTCRA